MESERAQGPKNKEPLIGVSFTLLTYDLVASLTWPPWLGMMWIHV